MRTAHLLRSRAGMTGGGKIHHRGHRGHGEISNGVKAKKVNATACPELVEGIAGFTEKEIANANAKQNSAADGRGCTRIKCGLATDEHRCSQIKKIHRGAAEGRRVFLLVWSADERGCSRIKTGHHQGSKAPSGPPPPRAGFTCAASSINPDTFNFKPGPFGRKPARLKPKPEAIRLKPKRKRLKPGAFGLKPERLKLKPEAFGLKPEGKKLKPEPLRLKPER